MTSDAGSLDELLLIESSSDRIVDALIVEALSESIESGIESIQAVRKFVGHEVVSALVRLEDGSAEISDMLLEGVVSLVAPISSIELCQVILKGVGENRTIENED